MTKTDPISVRFAQETDTPLILEFIRKLAEYEKLLDDVVATEEGLRKSLFGARPYGECLLAFDGLESESQAVGFALFFHNYSTFLGQPGLYLEDLFVDQSARGRGIGKRLLQELARIAIERDCERLEWWVLDWNTPSIDFYKSLGAEPMDDWTVYRLSGENLSDLADDHSP